MNHAWTRRQWLLGTAGALVSACARPRSTAHGGTANGEDTQRDTANASAKDAFAAIEAETGGRVGVFALDTGTGRWLAHRPDERFAMCSTFKLPLVAAVLSRVDRARLSLDERVAYAESDLLEHSPVTRAHVGAGSMSVEALAEAAITVSDNAAANLLLSKVDGPAGLTSFVRDLGDHVTRFDRREPELNENTPGDPRDTTSPRAMVTSMQTLFFGQALSKTSRELLFAWLHACATGKDRLRGGFPGGWDAGDKTGTGGRGTVNDVAIARPPARAPLLVAAYLSDGNAQLADLVAAQARIGALVAREL